MQTTETEVGTSWDSRRRIVETRLRGPVSLDDVSHWKDGLARAVAELPDGSRFKLLVDLHGFAPADLDVHRAMREVVPRLLAAHGMRPAYIDLFDERPELPVSRTREITCSLRERAPRRRAHGRLPAAHREGRPVVFHEPR